MNEYLIVLMQLRQLFWAIQQAGAQRWSHHQLNGAMQLSELMAAAMGGCRLCGKHGRF